MCLNDIVIVLSRPSEPGNAGAVCRAMKNMGLRTLRIAAPQFTLTGPELEKLLARAVHASDIWEEAEWFTTLDEALSDCSLSVGTSRRQGRRRKSTTLTPRELAAFLTEKNGKTAIVFGNERTGLDRNELERCNMASHIPVSPEFPSLNLSHAVQIYAYELHEALAGGCVSTGHVLSDGHAAPTGHTVPAVPGQWVPMTGTEIDRLVQNISNSLASLGFYKHPGRLEQERFLRDLAARAGLSLKEGRYLGNIIAKAGRLG